MGRDAHTIGERVEGFRRKVGPDGIDDINLISGSLPRRQQRLVEAWAELRQAELQRNWMLLETGHKPLPIAPLE
jgi:hypothetical protein